MEIKENVVGNIYESLGVLIPSRGRVDVLEKLLYSLVDSPNSDLLEVIVVSDSCAETLNSAKNFSFQENFFKYKALITPKRSYAVGTMNFCLNNCDSDLFCWIADDAVIDRIDWISFLIQYFGLSFSDGIGIGCLGCPGPGYGITTKKFVEYNDGELYHKGYNLHYADMEIGIRAVLMGRYVRLISFTHLGRHTGETGTLPHAAGNGFHAIRLKDRELYSERMKNGFFLDPSKIKNPEANEIFKKLREGIFHWPDNLIIYEKNEKNN